MNVDIHGAPIYFEIPILGGIKITASLVVTWGVMLVLTLLCVTAAGGAVGFILYRIVYEVSQLLYNRPGFLESLPEKETIRR